MPPTPAPPRRAYYYPHRELPAPNSPLRRPVGARRPSSPRRPRARAAPGGPRRPLPRSVSVLHSYAAALRPKSRPSAPLRAAGGGRRGGRPRRWLRAALECSAATLRSREGWRTSPAAATERESRWRPHLPRRRGRGNSAHRPTRQPLNEPRRAASRSGTRRWRCRAEATRQERRRGAFGLPSCDVPNATSGEVDGGRVWAVRRDQEWRRAAGGHARAARCASVEGGALEHGR